jgi:hypothetical protein
MIRNAIARSADMKINSEAGRHDAAQVGRLTWSSTVRTADMQFYSET